MNWPIFCSKRRIFFAFLPRTTRWRARAARARLARDSLQASFFDAVTSPHTDRPIVAVVGPTASAKANSASRWRWFSGESLNCDSCSYRATRSPRRKSPSRSRGIPHHLLISCRPSQLPAGVAREARKDGEIESRGRMSCSSSERTLLRALREPFFESPPTDEKLRRRSSDRNGVVPITFTHFSRLYPDGGALQKRDCRALARPRSALAYCSNALRAERPRQPRPPFAFAPRSLSHPP